MSGQTMRDSFMESFQEEIRCLNNIHIAGQMIPEIEGPRPFCISPYGSGEIHYRRGFHDLDLPAIIKAFGPEGWTRDINGEMQKILPNGVKVRVNGASNDAPYRPIPVEELEAICS